MTQDSLGKIPSCMRQRGVMLHGGAYQRPTGRNVASRTTNQNALPLRHQLTSVAIHNATPL